MNFYLLVFFLCLLNVVYIYRVTWYQKETLGNMLTFIVASTSNLFLALSSFAMYIVK